MSRTPEMKEILKCTSKIYRYAYQNPNTHKNTLRNYVVLKGVSSNKFAKTFEELKSEDKIVVKDDKVAINSYIIDVAVLQKKGDDFYIVTSRSNKHFPIGKSVASGYKPGDMLDVVIEDVAGEKEVFILGRSNKRSTGMTKTLPLEKESKDTSKVEKLPAGTPVSGRVIKVSHDHLVFIPNRKDIKIRHIPILNPSEEQAAFQDKLCIMNIVDLETPLLGGYIVDVKGDAGNPIHEYDAIAQCYGAIMDWNSVGGGLQKEISEIPTTVDSDGLSLISEGEAVKYGQRGKCVDLRHIPFTTVDPATCRDMDDAIYSTFDENGDIVCYTAVANVTKYVPFGSEICNKYMSAGFTIYSPNKAYNILPTQLSTGICSLNPLEDRLAFVVKTTIDKSNGSVKDSQIFDAIIQSRRKYSYEEAQEIADRINPETSKFDLYVKKMNGEELSEEEQVLMNYYAGQTIKVGFDQRKMIRFVSNKERTIKFDEDFQDVVDIEKVPHLYYHEVIEAFMITANEATAKYANDRGLDNVYRVHDEPNPRKLQRANEFFEILGVEFQGDLSAEGTRNLVDIIKNTANEEIVNNFLIKMQSRAVYSSKLYSEKKKKSLEEQWLGERISHYALQSKHYSHTTSPIRRVPDYVTQYNILANIHGTKPISKDFIDSIVENSNRKQLDIDQAEKEFQDISSVMYCEKHIGEKMSGRITKMRYCSCEEGYEDDIVVIVKNEDKGISVEIPLSQVIGRTTEGCELSEQRCAVYDARGNIVLKLCQPVDFIIEKADRKAMVVVGRTNKEMVSTVERGNRGYRRKGATEVHYTEKHKRDKRRSQKHRYDDRYNSLREDPEDSEKKDPEDDDFKE